MSEVLRISFMCLVWAFLLKFQIDYEQDQTATRYLKDGLEIAVHDAAMMLDVNQFSEGEIVFNQLLADEVFKLSFEKNMNVEMNSVASFAGGAFSPTDQSFFKETIDIIHVEFIDETTQPGAIYPCVYGVSCGLDVYDIVETIDGPSLVVVAETKSPRAFSQTEKIIRQAVVYEYKEQN